MPDPRPLAVHIITRLEPGGSSRNTVDSCAALAADYDVVLLAGPHKDSARLLGLLPPVVSYIEVKALAREISPLRDLSALLELRRELARLRPAIVHTHTSKAGALGRLAALLADLWRKERALVVHTPHGHLLYGYYGPFKTFLFRTAERLLARVTDYLIALTPGEREESLAAGIGRRAQWRVVHSGVELSEPEAPARKRDLGIAPDETVIGTVARLEPVKGEEFFVRAAALVGARRPGLKLRFVVVGGGSLEGRLRDLAGGLGLGGRILFTGHREDAASLMACFDVYVQPSLNEAMGRAALEAQALGAPAVVSRVCGLPDVVRDGETGLCVPPADPEALAEALEKLLLDRELRGRMGAAARKWALSRDASGLPRFGVGSMTARLSAFYRAILAKPPPR